MTIPSSFRSWMNGDHEVRNAIAWWHLNDEHTEESRPRERYLRLSHFLEDLGYGAMVTNWLGLRMGFPWLVIWGIINLAVIVYSQILILEGSILALADDQLATLNSLQWKGFVLFLLSGVISPWLQRRCTPHLLHNSLEKLVHEVETPVEPNRLQDDVPALTVRMEIERWYLQHPGRHGMSPIGQAMGLNRRLAEVGVEKSLRRRWRERLGLSLSRDVFFTAVVVFITGMALVVHGITNVEAASVVLTMAGALFIALAMGSVGLLPLKVKQCLKRIHDEEPLAIPDWHFGQGPGIQRVTPDREVG